jgi:hypothetical protein
MTIENNSNNKNNPFLLSAYLVYGDKESGETAIQQSSVPICPIFSTEERQSVSKNETKNIQEKLFMNNKEDDEIYSETNDVPINTSPKTCFSIFKKGVVNILFSLREGVQKR